MAAKDAHYLGLKLGKITTEGSLDPIPRKLGRGADKAEFFGYDLWNAYEVSFLLPSGKPVVYIMQASYDAHSPHMVESKSFKLFLNAQNNRRFAHLDAFAIFVRESLEGCIGAPVRLDFVEPGSAPSPLQLKGELIDSLQPDRLSQRYDPSLLTAHDRPGQFSFHSHLLRSNCPVTNQPDWGAVQIVGKGPCGVNRASFLAYLLSYRNHQGFHESCCEQIFCDLKRLLLPEHLEVACFYTRRGGLDINPFRSTDAHFERLEGTAWRQ